MLLLESETHFTNWRSLVSDQYCAKLVLYTLTFCLDNSDFCLGNFESLFT